MEKTSTCQICERIIKTKRGKTFHGAGMEVGWDDYIANHGYTRPWKQGWQSASCFGAKWRPYEVACDALPIAIERCEQFIASQKAHLEDFTKNPPETLTRFARYHGQKDEVFERPEGYVYNPEHGSFGHTEQYALQHHNAIYQIRKSIEHAEWELPKLQKRMAAWKKVVE